MNVSWNKTILPREFVLCGLCFKNHFWKVLRTTLGEGRERSNPATFSNNNRTGSERVTALAIGATGAEIELIR